MEEVGSRRQHPLTKLGTSSKMKPLINLKVDELFMKWISLPEQSDLFAKLEQIKENRNEGENLSTNFQVQKTAKNKKAKEVANLTIPAIIKDDSKPMLSPRRFAKNAKSRTSLEKYEPSNHISTNSITVDARKSIFVTNNNKSTKPIIPQFYFPYGKPNTIATDKTFTRMISKAFLELNTKRLKLSQMGTVCKACGCPLYWKSILFNKALKPGNTYVTESGVIEMWKSVVSLYHDEASRFVSLLAKKDNKYLEFDDLMPLLRDVVDTHPGLMFLKEAPEFHTRYMNTVIARIFYTVNRSWSGRISVNELRKSNFLSVLANLESEQDINVVTDYFSYEHFYVIYCKFWELDKDHDLVIDKNDLARHSDGVLSGRLIDRILSGAVTRWSDSATRTQCMSYVDFVWFLISEEDKTTNISIEYWFRCMDLDGDGFISLYEMEYFYEEQIRKLELLDIEPLPFDDCACQILDMIHPAKPECISLVDLKKSQMAGIFFDTFLNIEKYLEHEQKDPFANSLLDENDEAFELPKQSDWEKYAAEEYEVLVAEEQANEAKTTFSADNPFADVLEDELTRLDLMHDDPLNDALRFSQGSNSNGPKSSSLSQSTTVF
ncbi:serine/threonine-protein phosphatase 2A regulatory subunit B'' subunit delta-like [Styela clava]